METLATDGSSPGLEPRVVCGLGFSHQPLGCGTGLWEMPAGQLVRRDFDIPEEGDYIVT